MFPNDAAKKPSIKFPERSARLCSAALAFVVSTLAVVTPAGAESDDYDLDWKSRLGVECGANVPAALFVGGRSGAAMNNSASQAIDITCPIGRDGLGTQSLLLTAYLIKATGSGSMTCSLTFRDLESSAKRTLTKNVTGSGYQSITFTESDGSDIVQYGYDSAIFSCSVPKVVGTTPSDATRSGIVGYAYYEVP